MTQAVANLDAAHGEVLSQQALNRATLARQFLLERTKMPAFAMLEHLVGMQAQVPRSPYVGLWSRLEAFQPDELAALMASRHVVRAPLLRATIHMSTARDALFLWPLIAPILRRNLFTGSPFGRNLQGMDLDALLAAGRALIEERPRTTVELKRLLGEAWPGRDGASLAYAINRLLPVVQVTPRGLWTESGQTAWTTFEAWLGLPPEGQPSLETLIRRYLGAFGPASVADMQNWSGLTRLRDAFEGLRSSMLSFRNERGKELFDLPEAPRPDQATPAPVRFLPVYDNLLLGHADRSRFYAGDMIVPPAPDTVREVGSILVDGFARGIWKIDRKGSAGILQIETFPGMPEGELSSVREEGQRLLAFAAADAKTRAIEFVTFSAVGEVRR
jgi:hypothetical protein